MKKCFQMTTLLTALLLSGNLLAQFTAAGVVYSNRYIFKDSHISWALQLPNADARDFDFDNSGRLWVVLGDDLYIEQDGDPVNCHTYWADLGITVSSRLDAVNCVKRDKTGKIWIGTTKGICCFDGKTIQEIPVTPQMPFNIIHEIGVDGDGHIWAAGVETYGGNLNATVNPEKSGIARFDDKDWVSFTGKNSQIPCAKVQDLTFTDDGSVWMIGSEKVGLVRLKDKAWTSYNADNAPLLTTQVRALAFDALNKRLLVGTDGGMLAYDGQSWQKPEQFTGIKDVWDIAVNDNVVWISIYHDGVLRVMDHQRVRLHRDNSPIMTNRVNKIITHNGFAWFMERDLPSEQDPEIFGGVCGVRFGLEGLPEGWNYFNHYNSMLRLGDALDIQLTQDENFTIRYKKEIKKNNHQERVDLFESHEDDRFFVSGLNQSGDLFFVSKLMGLCRCRDGEVTVIKPFDKKLFSNDLSNLIVDENGIIWISSKDDGILKCTPDGQVSMMNKKNANLPKDHVNTIFFDSQKRLWAGTSKGLCLLEGSRFKTFTKKESDLPDNDVYAISEDKNGRIYIGTQKGLAIYEDGQITMAAGIPRTDILQLCCDKDGSIWVGTIDAGLFRLDDHGCKNFLKEGALRFTKIKYIRSNQAGDKIWVAATEPRLSLPSFTFPGKLSKATKDAEYLEKMENRTKEEEKELIKLKKEIGAITSKAKYEDDLYMYLKRLYPEYAFVSIDI